MGFKFKLGDEVVIIGSVIVGEVISRAEYSPTEYSYLLRIKAYVGTGDKYWVNEGYLTINALPVLSSYPICTDQIDARLSAPSA